MKKENSLVFFPGKGIFTNPDSTLQPVVEVYKKEEAIRLLREFTRMLVNRGKPASTEARKLFNVHGAITDSKTPRKESDPFKSLCFSDNFNISDTRVSCGNGSVDWVELRGFLEAKGYRVIKRKNSLYIKSLDRSMVHVYAVVHDNFGVVAEGKGFTDEQAMKSALSEAVERCFSSGSDESEIVVGSQESLLGNGSNLMVAAGMRDVYDNRIYTEWVRALDVINDTGTYLPAEVAFFNYTPKKIRLKLFSLSHTTGMAAGASAEDAVLNGIFEIIERDAYWLTMRCKINCPDIDLKKIKDINPAVISLFNVLSSLGFEIVIKDMSLDWGVPVAHVVLKDQSGRIPCFAHGSGAGSTWVVAIARALAEAVQMYFGMKEFANIPDNWEKVISAQGNLGSGILSWSDPLYGTHLSHLLSK
jgi:hypothetical protein